ncbi:hypothetical protein VW41_01995 [Klebsiella michiganensis]|nr:hypothetical protein VW41_01995 [Klebsiella michiganensis]
MSGLLFVWPGAGRDVDRQEKGAEGLAAFGSGGKNHPWAGAGPVVARTVCSSAITPGACRGSRRHRLAHIRAQREPVFAPAGTGTEYR